MSAPTNDVLAQEHAQLRAAVRGSRKEFARSVEGQFARVMWGAVSEYLRMLADGVPREDALKGLEDVVRDVWPRGREREWKYLCDDCRDTGWEYRRCRAFNRCQPKHDDWPSEREHDCVVACHCPKGDRFKRRSAPISTEQELAQVGKTRRKSSGGWSRPGR
jgi:hypothetical protein